MSGFDPENFMHQEVEAAMDTSFTPVPEGEYPAYVKDVGARTVTTKNGPSPMLDITFAITDEEVAKELGMEEVSVRQSLFLDLTEDGLLAFDANSNVRLGRLRKALGQNVDGAAWAPSHMVGAGPVQVLVGHRQAADGDEIYAEVRKVKALS